jgi:hypothetical protein
MMECHTGNQLTADRKTKKKMQKEQRGNYGEGVFNVEDNRDKRREAKKEIGRIRKQEEHWEE